MPDHTRHMSGLFIGLCAVTSVVEGVQGIVCKHPRRYFLNLLEVQPGKNKQTSSKNCHQIQ
jgi:hypothetical protein